MTDAPGAAGRREVESRGRTPVGRADGPGWVWGGWSDGGEEGAILDAKEPSWLRAVCVPASRERREGEADPRRESQTRERDASSSSFSREKEEEEEEGGCFAFFLFPEGGRDKEWQRGGGRGLLLPFFLPFPPLLTCHQPPLLPPASAFGRGFSFESSLSPPVFATKPTPPPLLSPRTYNA